MDYRVIGHFTAMITDRSTQIGCGISSYQSKSGRFTMTNYLLACNYASTNMIGWPVYKSGTKASGCLSGSDQVYPGLCASKENIDPNSNLNWAKHIDGIFLSTQLWLGLEQYRKTKKKLKSLKSCSVSIKLSDHENQVPTAFFGFAIWDKEKLKKLNQDIFKNNIDIQSRKMENLNQIDMKYILQRNETLNIWIKSVNDFLKIARR